MGVNDPVSWDDIVLTLKAAHSANLANYHYDHMKSLFAKRVKSTPTCSSFTFQKYAVNTQ